MPSSSPEKETPPIKQEPSAELQGTELRGKTNVQWNPDFSNLQFLD